MLPSYAAPAHLDYLNVYTLNGTLGVLRIDWDGSLHAYGGEAQQRVDLRGAPVAGQADRLFRERRLHVRPRTCTRR